MEERTQLENNGQQLTLADVNRLGEVSGLADDRVLWELLRLLPGDDPPQKGILPYGVSGWRPVDDHTAFIWGSTADAVVRVRPFRAIVGSRTDFMNDAAEHLRGIRSGYMIGASALEEELTIAANASGDPRWTLIYAVVTPDADGESDTRLIKDPTSKVVAPDTVVLTTRTRVTVAALDGTPAASPTRPDLPSDGGGSYYIALAYVYVADGFGASSTVMRQYIHEVAPCLPIHSALGVPNIAPADQQYVVGGTVDVNQSGDEPTAPNYFRPGAYLPPTMLGGEERVVLIQRALAPLSHEDGDVIDASIDWRHRYFTWHVSMQVGSTVAAAFASDRALTGTAPTPNPATQTLGATAAVGMGQSFVDDGNGAAVNIGTVAFIDETVLSSLGSGESWFVYVRGSDGALVFKTSGTPTLWNAILWIRATGPYALFKSYVVA